MYSNLIHSVLSLLLSISSAAAQDAAVPTIISQTGDIVEIGFETQIQNPVYNWILAKDNQFVSAQRTAFFQSRQSVAGTYVIDASIQSETTPQTDYQSFQMIVEERTSPRPTPPPQSDTLVPRITTFPPLDQFQTAALPPEGGFLMIYLSQSRGAIKTYMIDYNEKIDSDEDGNPTNDFDNKDTINASSGTPIYYYFPAQSSPRVITVTLEDANGEEQQLSLTLRFDGVAQRPQLPVGSAEIIAESSGNTAKFYTEISGGSVDAKHLLYEWDFGDGNRSLTRNPSHTYARGDQYDVTVTIRDISTGEIIGAGETSVDIQTTQNTSSVSSSSSSEDTVDGAEKGGGMIKVIMIIVGILAFAIALFLLIRLIKNRASGALQKKIEDTEKKLFAKDDDAEQENTTEDNAVPHLTLQRNGAVTENAAVQDVPKAEVVEEAPPEPATANTAKDASQDAVIEREKETTEFQSTTKQPESPIAEAGPVPDWLQKTDTQNEVAEPSPVERETEKAPEPAVEEATQKPTEQKSEVSDAERERRRRKRQRYRQNKKRREEEAAKQQATPAVETPVQPNAATTTEEKQQSDPTEQPPATPAPESTPPKLESTPTVDTPPVPQPKKPMQQEDGPVPDWLAKGDEQQKTQSDMTETTSPQPIAQDIPQADPNEKIFEIRVDSLEEKKKDDGKDLPAQ